MWFVIDIRGNYGVERDLIIRFVMWAKPEVAGQILSSVTAPARIDITNRV